MDEIFISKETKTLGGDLNTKHKNWNSITTNTDRALTSYADRQNYHLGGPEKPRHFGIGRAVFLNLFTLENIKHTQQIYTVTELSFNHYLVFMGSIDWQENYIVQTNKKVNLIKYKTIPAKSTDQYH